MTIEQLEFYLNRHNSFGYNTENNGDVVGWIMLSKRFPSESFLKRFDESNDPATYRDQMKIKSEPYVVWIAQMSREVFESEKFPGNEDYLLNISYTFKSLDDVNSFLKEMGYDLSELKWATDVDFL